MVQKNCNEFCDWLCEELGVQSLPPWVARFGRFAQRFYGKEVRQLQHHWEAGSQCRPPSLRDFTDCASEPPMDGTGTRARITASSLGGSGAPVLSPREPDLDSRPHVMTASLGGSGAAVLSPGDVEAAGTRPRVMTPSSWGGSGPMLPSPSDRRKTGSLGSEAGVRLRIVSGVSMRGVESESLIR